MRIRQLVFAFVALAGLPAGAAAGPIEFTLTPIDLRGYDPFTGYGGPTTPVVPVLVPHPAGGYSFDPSGGKPTVVAAVDYDPTRLPLPAPRDIHPDGTTHWNMEQYFRVTLRLTDAASGQAADFDLGGRAHIYNQYANGQWGGVTWFWFQDEGTAILGGNTYTVWGANMFDGTPAAANVWVGDNPPVHNSPEPTTLVLGGLALLPVGLRVLRRKRN
jgi:hypothetical protein